MHIRTFVFRVMTVTNNIGREKYKAEQTVSFSAKHRLTLIKAKFAIYADGSF